MRILFLPGMGWSNLYILTLRHTHICIAVPRRTKYAVAREWLNVLTMKIPECIQSNTGSSVCLYVCNMRFFSLSLVVPIVIYEDSCANCSSAGFFCLQHKWLVLMPQIHLFIEFTINFWPNACCSHERVLRNGNAYGYAFTVAKNISFDLYNLGNKRWIFGFEWLYPVSYSISIEVYHTCSCSCSCVCLCMHCTFVTLIWYFQDLNLSCNKNGTKVMICFQYHILISRTSTSLWIALFIYLLRFTQKFIKLSVSILVFSNLFQSRYFTSENSGGEQQSLVYAHFSINIMWYRKSLLQKKISIQDKFSVHTIIAI